jgi:hypothetical protein
VGHGLAIRGSDRFAQLTNQGWTLADEKKRMFMDFAERRKGKGFRVEATPRRERRLPSLLCAVAAAQQRGHAATS